MIRRRLLVIGAGVVTGGFLDEFVRCGGTDQYAVTVVGEEPYGPYNRLELNRVLRGAAPDELVTKPVDWFEARDIRWHCGTRVERLDPVARTAWCDGGEALPYDVAVLATGSVPLRPAVPVAKGTTHVLRTMADAVGLREALGGATKGSAAAVIGGGTLGLETAVQLAALGLAVTLVHPRPILLDQHLDEVAGRLVRRTLERHRITVLTARVILVGTRGRDLEDPGAKRVVRCADGRELVVDHVVFTTGARPRVDLAERSGLRVGRGVQVDDRLRTSAAGVHAIGDCVEHRGTVYGTAAPGLEQAHVLAALLTGAHGDARYHGSLEWTRVVAGGLDVLALGASTTVPGTPPDVAGEGIAAGDDIVEIIEERRGVYRKVVTRDGRLQGAIVVGDPDLVPRLGGIFDRGGQLPANVLDLFASWSGAAGAFEVDPEVCRCRRVGEAKLRAALAAGCTTVESLMEDTGAGQVCGSCLPVLSRLAAGAGEGGHC